jgi:predicted AAA+ superfamily ATPase
MAPELPLCDSELNLSCHFAMTTAGYISRLLQPPKGHFFLLGPRGTGKTAWCREQFKNALRIDLLDAAVLREYSSQPERLISLVEANPGKKQIVIDEIQKLPELLDAVHLLIERKTGHQFVLTGSSARKLRRQSTNLLGGRALQRHLHPYMAAELGSRFDLQRALKQGLLPVVWASSEPEETLQAYNGLYLREEVQMEGLVRNVGDFARFLETMSFAHASVINFSNIARESHINRKTVENFAQILEDLLLGFQLDVFSKRAKRGLATHPKFYFFDTGIFRANRPRGPLDSQSELNGLALEGLVAQHLHAWCAYTSDSHQLYYWHTRTGVEVDFVIYGPSGLYAIEVKNANRIRPEDLKGLTAFADDYPQSRRYFLYRGQERQLINGTLCMPCTEFLSQLHPGKFPEA